MKASNWHHNYVRHTRTVNRVSHNGEIQAYDNEIKLISGSKHMLITFTDEELNYLTNWLKKRNQ